MITNLLTYGVDEEDKRTVYMLTKSPKIEKISDLPDHTIIKIDSIAFFTEINEERETESNIVSVMDLQGNVYATNSLTFQRELKDIIDIMGTERFDIEKLSGISKSSREFVTCSLA